MKILTSETNLTSATNIGNSPVVRIYNSDSSSLTLTRKSNEGTTIGTYSIPSGKVIYCEKSYADTLEGGVALKATGVGYSEELEIISLSSTSINYVTSNLRIHLDADSYSGSGDWLDATSNDNDGTIDGATYSAESGSNPAYFSFDGTNDDVEITDTESGGTGGGLNTYDLLSGSNNYSISLWFQTAEFPATTFWQISPVLFKAGQRSIYLVHGDSTAVNKLALHGNWTVGGWGKKVESNTLSLNTWYNICFTYNTTDGYVCYQNGSSVSTNSTPRNSANTYPSDSTIGRPGDSDNYQTNRSWEGKMAIFSIYEKTLSATEVTQNYDAFKSRYGLS